MYCLNWPVWSRTRCANTRVDKFKLSIPELVSHGTQNILFKFTSLYSTHHDTDIYYSDRKTFFIHHYTCNF